VKNLRPKHKITSHDNASGNYYKCASFLRSKRLINRIDKIVADSEEIKINIVPFRLESDIIEKFFVEGIDFILVEYNQIDSYLKKIDPSIVLGLPIVIVVENAESIKYDDLKNLRIIDILSRNDISESAIFKTQLLLQSSLNSNLINFFDSLNKDSFFESLFGKLEEAVSILDENARYIWINNAYEELLGYSLEELSGRTPALVMSEDDMNIFIAFLKEKSNNYKGIHKVTDKNGRIINIELSVFVIVDKNTELVRIASIKRKLTTEKEIEQQLIFTEEKFQKFVNNIDDLITVTDMNGKISYVSPGFNKSLGYYEAELTNTLIYEYVHPEDIRSLRNVINKKIKGEFDNLRFRFRKKNGDYIWLESRGEPLFDHNRQNSGIILGASVIHEQLLSEEKLKEIEFRYKILVNRIYDLVLDVDPQGKVINVFGNSKDVLKMSSLSLIGKKFIDFIYEKDVIETEEYLKKKSAHFETRFLLDENDCRWFDVTMESFSDSSTDYPRIIILKDIHDNKDILRKINESDSLYRSLTENIQDIIIRIDKNLQVVYANSVAKNQLFENKNLKNLEEIGINPDEKEKLLHSIERSKHTLNTDQLEVKLSKQGKAVFYNWSIIPEYNDHGEFFSLLLVARNVTPYVVAKYEITKLKSIIENSTNSIIVTDRMGNIEYVNPAVEELSGYNQYELLGKNPRIFKTGNTTIEEYEKLWETISGGNIWKGTFKNKKKNGEYFWEFAIISPIMNFDGEIVNYLAIKENITRQKVIEDTLRSNQEKLNLTLEGAQVGTWVINIPEKMIYWDEQVIKLCGYTVEELIQGNLKNLKNFIHPDDFDRVVNLYQQSLENYNTLDIEFKIITKLGLTKHVFAKGQIIRNESGQPVRMDGISMDITSQKTIEENLKLRNEELNQFVYKVSHDLRAPLASIRGIIELEKLQNKSRSQFKYVRLIEDRISNLDQFMRNILSHSRNLNTSVRYKQIDFQQITDDCFKELEFLRNALSIKRIVKISKSTFHSDESRLFEIFRNLISNSIKYLDYDKSEPYIKITVKSDSTRAVITFEDNGVGIDPDLQKYIFDMFYRANEKSDGSGIGLYIVKQAVEKLNGSISVKSKKGDGTRFQVIIPNAIPEKLN
jgi:PAS domain S-box-containing protein